MYKGENFDLENELTARRKELGLEQMDATELKMRRTELNFTQARLAGIFGIARNTVARWENDRLKIPRWADLSLQSIEMETVRNRTGYNAEMMTRKREHFLALAKAAGESNEPDESNTSDNESCNLTANAQLDSNAEYYNKSGLIQRGWTDSMIRNLLGGVEIKRGLTCSAGVRNFNFKYFYEVNKIHAIENTAAFKERGEKKYLAKQSASDNE
jgi:DNA-binding transcriptional regulator YiaG